jgi:branched-chain amino acid aminotransferase
MSNYCAVNGVIQPVSEAKIGINDIGLLRSYAVFDYMRTYNGNPFGFADYMLRFRGSAASLRLPLNYSDQEIEELIKGLVQKSELKEAGIRLILTGGYSSDSISFNEPNFIIVIEELPQYPQKYYSEGVKLITSEYQRETAGSKTTDYLNAIKLEPVKKAAGAFDLLYYSKGNVLEVARNNIFFFIDGILVTPKDDILLGVTRKYVLEIARKYFKVEERAITLDEMWSASEVFITGTSKKIIPIVNIDDQLFSSGSPGKYTKEMIAYFDAFVKEY